MSKSETGPEGWLQIQHPRLNIEFFRNLSFRQSIQRSSPIVDHYYPLRWSVPISACPLTASDAGCTSDVPKHQVLDLALYRYYSIDAHRSQFALQLQNEYGILFEYVYLVFCVFSIICQVYDMFRYSRIPASSILQQLPRISGMINIADNRITDFHHISVRPNNCISVRNFFHRRIESSIKALRQLHRPYSRMIRNYHK